MANYEIGPQFTVEQNDDGTIKLINLQTLLFRKRAKYVIDTGFRYLGADAQRIVVHHACESGKFTTVQEHHSDFANSLRITVIPDEECSLTIAKWSVVALISIEKQSLATLKHVELSMQEVIADPHPALELSKTESSHEEKQEQKRVEHACDDNDVAQLFQLLPDICEETRVKILEQMESMRLKWKREGKREGMDRTLYYLPTQRYDPYFDYGYNYFIYYK